jgi:N-acetylmuramoyl-L-alanine amidase
MKKNLSFLLFAFAILLLVVCFFTVLFFDNGEKTEALKVSNTCTIYHEDGTTEEYVPNLGAIVIDAGHGGVDPGKVSLDGTLEKDINLQIALRLRIKLESEGYTVIMTRTTDEDTCTGDYGKTKDLETRTQTISAANALLAVSIHQNSFSEGEVFGAQVFYKEADNESMLLACSIQESMKALNPDNKREAKANSDYYLFRNVEIPIVIVECGFLSNPEEEKLLKNSDYQQQIAECIYKGIKDFLNL